MGNVNSDTWQVMRFRRADITYMQSLAKVSDCRPYHILSAWVAEHKKKINIKKAGAK